MSVDTAIIEHLLAIRTTLDQHTDDFREIKGRLGSLINHHADPFPPNGNFVARFDSIDQRLARIEERLERGKA